MDLQIGRYNLENLWSGKNQVKGKPNGVSADDAIHGPADDVQVGSWYSASPETGLLTKRRRSDAAPDDIAAQREGELRLLKEIVHKHAREFPVQVYGDFNTGGHLPDSLGILSDSNLGTSQTYDHSIRASDHLPVAMSFHIEPR